MYPPQDVDLANVDLNLLVVFDVLMRERSVSRAAQVLHRTPSAISHALARLRQQLDDPVLVRSGTGMAPTDYAYGIWKEVRRVLHDVRSVLRRSSQFDPSTSQLALKFAMADVHPDLFWRVFAPLRQEAPHMRLLWQPVHDSTLEALADGEIDLAVLPRPPYPVESVTGELLFTLQWCCGMRVDHPATHQWSPAAFAKWPHVSVQTGDKLHAPVVVRASEEQLDRFIALIVPNFCSIPDVLQNSDLIATMPRLMLQAIAGERRLALLDVPFALPPLEIVLYRSKKSQSDPAVSWSAGRIAETLMQMFEETEMRFGASPARGASV